MASLYDVNRLKWLIDRAMQHGAKRLSQTVWEWDTAGRCERPVVRELEARPIDRWGGKMVYVARGTAHPLVLRMHVPCRRCRPCQRKRMRTWAERGVIEVRQAQRTWFCTFTFRPEALYALMGKGLLRREARAIPLSEATETTELQAQFEECAREITLYLKRVRKNSGARIRYLLVAERHKSGLPHFHALVHEVAGTVKYEHLRRAWPHGFGEWKLLRDEGAAYYVTKYLGKAQEARVRASLRYGEIRPCVTASEGERVLMGDGAEPERVTRKGKENFSNPVSETMGES